MFKRAPLTLHISKYAKIKLRNIKCHGNPFSCSLVHTHVQTDRRCYFNRRSAGLRDRLKSIYAFMKMVVKLWDLNEN